MVFIIIPPGRGKLIFLPQAAFFSKICSPASGKVRMTWNIRTYIVLFVIFSNVMALQFGK